MAHAICACFVDRSEAAAVSDYIVKISDLLEPADIAYLEPHVAQNDGIVAGVINKPDSLPVNGINVAVGNFLNDSEEWHKVGGYTPDGSYALFRGDSTHIQVATDVYSSRPIWYFHDEDKFLAATSQRALLALLGNFSPNVQAPGWMLSNGVLGAKISWDDRLHRVPPDTILTLDRDSWTCALQTTELCYSPKQASKESHKSRLASAIKNSVSSMRIDFAKWPIALSGGYDSRGIIQAIGEQPNLRSITWGKARSGDDKRSDAAVAAELSQKYKTAHTYYELDPKNVDTIGRVFDSFVAHGEGLVDNISGYTDGFRMWRNIYNDGIEGIIRGDEAFGNTWRETTEELYKDWRFFRLQDYSNTQELIQKLKLPAQDYNPADMIKENEEMGDYIDRLYFTYLMPASLAGLNLIKSYFCELINPLLSREIAESIRSQPYTYRNDKSLFKEIVEENSGDIKLASKGSTSSRAEFLGREDVVAYIFEYLRSQQTGVFSSEAIEFIVKHAEKSTVRKKSAFMRQCDRLLNKARKTLIKVPDVPRVDYMAIALRALIVCKIYELLEADSRALSVN